MSVNRIRSGEGVKFLSHGLEYPGTVLDVEGDECVWVIVYKLREVFEVYQGHILDIGGANCFCVFERRRSVDAIISGVPDGDIQSPFFEFAKNQENLINKVKLYWAILLTSDVVNASA